MEPRTRSRRLRLSAVVAFASLVTVGFAFAADFSQLFQLVNNLRAGRYYPVQLHLHGSMSEGSASMRVHNVMAKDLGTVDALWWTDHDWRIAGHGHVPGFSFDTQLQTFPVPYRDTPFSRDHHFIHAEWEEETEAGVDEFSTFLTDDVVLEGEHALEMNARAAALGGEWQWAGILLTNPGGLMRSPLAADMEIDLKVHPLTTWSDDSRLVIRVELSRQAETWSEMMYILGDPGEPRVEEMGRWRLGIMPIVAPAGEWSRLVLNVTHDADQLGLGGWDNSLRKIRIGMDVRRNATAGLIVDDLRLRRQRSGTEVLARAEEIAASLEHQYGVVNHVGLELSYADHVNVYLPRIEMPNFEQHPHGMKAEEIVPWAHERGGVVSLNHVFGTTPQNVDQYDMRSRRVLENRAFGADLLEVGYPHRVYPLERHLEIWDDLSRQQVFIGGIGTSDSHDHNQGWVGGNNYVTWVRARGPGRRDLIRGLRERNAFFGDPMRFQGELRLQAAGRNAMGRVIRTDGRPQDVALTITDLPADSTVRWIEQGKVVKVFEPPPGKFTRLFRVPTSSYRFARAEVWQAERGLAFSNCVYFLPSWEEEGRPRVEAVARPVKPLPKRETR